MFQFLHHALCSRCMKPLTNHSVGAKLYSTFLVKQVRCSTSCIQQVQTVFPCVLCNVDSALLHCLHWPLQVKHDLLGANTRCGIAIAGIRAGGSAWQQLKEAKEEVQREHSAAMASVNGAEPRHWCASLQAVGCMMVGDFEQVHSPPFPLSTLCDHHFCTYTMLLQKLLIVTCGVAAFYRLHLETTAAHYILLIDARQGNVLGQLPGDPRWGTLRAVALSVPLLGLMEYKISTRSHWFSEQVY